MPNPSSLMQLIQVLREVDKEIDIARSSVQLKMLIFAGEYGELDLRRASATLNIESKPLIDAAQKLKRKNLIERKGKGIYKLTPRGKKIYQLLKTLAKALDSEKIFETIMFADIILVVGTWIEEWVDARWVARELKIDVNQLKEILSGYDGIYVKMKSEGKSILLSLTREGKTLYKQLLRMRGLGPHAAQMLALLTATLKPLEALRRFMVVYTLITLLIAYELTTPLGIISGAAWAAVSIYIAFLIYSRI